MSNRIVSNSTFAVNSDLEQVVEVNGNVNVIAPTGLDMNLIEVGGSSIAIGQAAKAACLPVTLASDEDTLNVSDSTAQASLSTLAGAVSGTEMQVDIVSSSGTLAVSDSTAQGSLSTIAGAVSGTEMQVDIVSSATLNVDLDSVNGSSISLGSTTGTNCIPVVIASDQNTLPVSFSAGSNSGSEGNLVNNASKSSGDFSSEVDVDGSKNITISGTTTDASSNAIEIYTAHSSGGTKYKVSFDIYPDINGNFYENLDNVALNYLYLKFTNTTAATITASAIHN